MFLNSQLFLTPCNRFDNNIDTSTRRVISHLKTLRHLIFLETVAVPRPSGALLYFSVIFLLWKDFIEAIGTPMPPSRVYILHVICPLSISPCWLVLQVGDFGCMPLLFETNSKYNEVYLAGSSKYSGKWWIARLELDQSRFTDLRYTSKVILIDTVLGLTSSQ